MTLPNPSTALAAVLVDELSRNGVRHLVLGPGSRSAPVAMAAADHPDLGLHVHIDERSAGFAALGIGRASGAPAAVLTTSGTAAVNLHPAVVEADAAGVPLLVLTADRPPELRHTGANQTIDQIGLFGDAVRWFCEVGVAEDRPGSNPYWRSTVCRAVTEAFGHAGRGGPVHLNLAFRDPLVPASDDGRAVDRPFGSPTDGRPDGDAWTRRSRTGVGSVELSDRWTSVDRGLVVVGDLGGSPFGPTLSEIDGLAARLGWPLVVEPPAGGRPPQTISTAHHLLGHPGFTRRYRPEAALVLGRAGLSRNLAGLLAGVPTVVADPGTWSDPSRSAEEMLAAWPSIRPGPAGSRDGEWRRGWLEAERVARTALDTALDAGDEPTEPRVARDVARAAAGGRLVVASSMPVRDLDWFMAPGDVEILSNRGASGIDGFVSTALGVAAVSGHPVTALAGDLSILHDAGGFLVEPRPDAVFVVIDNDGGGIFSFLPQAGFPEHFEQVFGTPRGRSFERLAAFHDLGFRPVDGAAELVPAVTDAHRAGGVHIVVVRGDRARNVEVHRRLTDSVSQALDEWLGAG
ncbi:MAG: 2-succinyl-5-enolpyruvyl-6-hydroxy-3-cyclohexene-1-carboxylic-acid synthase [Acidimicrobiia bacterium]